MPSKIDQNEVTEIDQIQVDRGLVESIIVWGAFWEPVGNHLGYTGGT